MSRENIRPGAVCAEHETFIFENLALVENTGTCRPARRADASRLPSTKSVLHEDKSPASMTSSTCSIIQVAARSGVCCLQLIRQAMVDENFRAARTK